MRLDDSKSTLDLISFCDYEDEGLNLQMWQQSRTASPSPAQSCSQICSRLQLSCLSGQGTRVRTQAPAIVDNLRIVVFIDDLDRCHQPIILELLCVINLILAQCEINVILGIEKSMVHRAVTQVFLKGSNDPKLAEAFANKYLQKIIQLPIQLPNLGQHELASFLEGQIGSNQNIKNVNIDHERRRNDDSSASV